MSRPKLNLLVDALALALALLVVSTGLVMEWALPPGSGRVEGACGACGSERDILLVWGLDRHEWGSLHLWAACAMLVVLATHVALHWRWIVATVRRQQPTGHSGPRLLIGVLALALAAATLTPLLGRPYSVPRSQVRRSRGLPCQAAPESQVTVSVEELAAITGVEAQVLRERLGASRVTVGAGPSAGRSLYEQKCLGCHGASGIAGLGGDRARALASLRQARPEQVHRGLREMAQYDLEHLLDYLRTLPAARVAGLPARSPGADGTP